MAYEGCLTTFKLKKKFDKHQSKLKLKFCFQNWPLQASNKQNKLPTKKLFNDHIFLLNQSCRKKLYYTKEFIIDENENKLNND